MQGPAMDFNGATSRSRLGHHLVIRPQATFNSPQYGILDIVPSLVTVDDVEAHAVLYWKRLKRKLRPTYLDGIPLIFAPG